MTQRDEPLEQQGLATMIRPVMNFTQLLRPFSNRSADRRVKVSRQRRSRHYGSLPSQALEDRILLSAYVVNTTADVVANDGLVSLREAVLAANTNAASGDAVAGSANGDSITFDASVFTSGTTITLTSGELSITDDLTITGTLGNVIIDANDTSRIFNVNSAENVTLSGLSLENGSFLLSNGGAILKNGSGQLNVTNSDLISNDANYGGAIAAFLGTTILENTVIADGSATISGGGIWIGNTATVQVNNSTLENNLALGAAAINGGGAIYNNLGQLTVTSSLLTDNGASGASGSGGALFVNGGTTTINDSELSDNFASRAGGAIEAATGATLTVNDSLLGSTIAGQGNFAGSNPGNGGGLHITGAGSNVVFNGGSVENNTASREGGGLWNDAGSILTLNDVYIANNTAAGAAANDGGGGVFNNGGTTNIFNGIITANRATGTGGSGGGLFSLGGTVNVTGTTFTSNTASRAGGAIEVAAAATVVLNNVTQGGATAASGNRAAGLPGNGGALHVTGAGSAVTLNGGVVQNNFAAREGGGLWNDAGSTMNVNNARIVNNIAQGTAADDGGGGIFNNGGNTVINQTTIAGNSATGRFGAGGGIHSNGGVVTLKNSTVNHNNANAGGGLANLDGEMNVVNATISSNKARTGGGIANYANMDITNATIVLNEGYAGGIYAYTGSDTLMNNSIVGGNKGEQDSDDDIVGWLNANSSYNIVSDSRSAGNLRNNRQGNQIGNGGSGQILIGSVIDTTLKNNGGPTSTHALKRHGAAINAGSNALAVDENGVALTRDQRGFARYAGGTVDIGAYEYIDLA